MLDPRVVSDDALVPIDPMTWDPQHAFGLSGQSYVVAGAGRGIGIATCRLLSFMGANLLCVDVDGARAREIARSVHSPYVVADVTDESDVARVVTTAQSEFGSVHGLVDIVGAGAPKVVTELSLDEWDQELRRNLTPVFLLGRGLGPVIARSGGGAMVFLASTAGLTAMASLAGYAAAKAGVISLVKSLASALGPYGVRVNAIAPGATLTPRVVNELMPENERMGVDFVRTTFLRRPAQCHEQASAAVFLLTTAASHITGVTIPVDGGATQRSPHMPYETIVALSPQERGA